ncbi:MAG: hypothetical protein MAG451_00099 [Anaerolineales bacterium]|nr:hypothetical protein [Anaerolineales bacterium]
MASLFLIKYSDCPLNAYIFGPVFSDVSAGYLSYLDDIERSMVLAWCLPITWMSSCFTCDLRAPRTLRQAPFDKLRTSLR